MARHRVRTRTRSAVRALASVEGKRLLRHPLFVFALVASAALFAKTTWEQAPVLSFDSVLVALALVPLAGATFLVSNWAMLRSKRHRTTELYSTTAVSATERTLGHLLAVGWAVAAAAVLAVAELGYLFVLRPVGTVQALEVLAGPLTVALAGAMGVALGRWWPSIAVAPILLVGLTTGAVFLANAQGHNRFRWVVPVVPTGSPWELQIRHAGVHTVYVVALTALIGIVALLRTDRSVRLRAMGAGLLVVTVATALAQVRPITAAQRAALASTITNPEPMQACRTIDGISYCAYRAYEGWIPMWAAVVNGVVRAAPAGDSIPSLRLRQQIWTLWEGDLSSRQVVALDSGGRDPSVRPFSPAFAGTITPAMEWGRARTADAFDLGLALAVAGRVAGFPTRPSFPQSPQCQSLNQGRAIVALWLAGQSSPAAASSLRAEAAANTGLVVVGPHGEFQIQYRTASGPAHLRFDYDILQLAELEVQEYRATGAAPVIWGATDLRYAVQLLDRPAAAVRAELGAHWRTLTNPSTTSAQVVRMLGLRPAPTFAQQLTREGVPAAAIAPMVKWLVESSAGGVPTCR
jgi:hypothetical protein